MSSTARGGKREASDCYVTPAWAVAEFLEEFTGDALEIAGDDLTSHDLIVLDPCAGGDEKRAMAYPQGVDAFNHLHFSAGRGARWDVQIFATVDIRPDSRAKFKADYLKWDCAEMGMQPDIIITNPPFALAMPIIEKALKDVRMGGLVIMLQRLNFFGGQHEKRGFFSRVGLPVATYVHRRRMQFHPPGTLNSKGKPMGGGFNRVRPFCLAAGEKSKMVKAADDWFAGNCFNTKGGATRFNSLISSRTFPGSGGECARGNNFPAGAPKRLKAN